MPLMQLRTLVLPAPFGPISANNSPAWAANDTSSSTVRPPKRKLKCSTASSAIPPPRSAVLFDVTIGPALAAGLTEVECLHIPMAFQPFAIAGEDDAAIFHHVGIVSDFERDCGALLDQQDGDAHFIANSHQPAREILDHDRSKPQRQFIDQQQFRPAH